MSIYALLIPTFVQMLSSLSGLLGKGQALAQDKGWEPAELTGARLAPDMFPLSDQVRFACIQALEAVARLTGHEMPPPLRGEDTIEGLRTQIARTLDVLRDVSGPEIDGGANRSIELVLPAGLTFRMSGSEFVRDWAIPQFYFHLVTAYAILRHKGVGIGKADYVRHMSSYLQPGSRTPSTAEAFAPGRT